MKIDIIYEDKTLIICRKPAGVSSEESGMPELLAAQTGLSRVFCVHRLDRDVSGVMVYAKNGKTAAALSAMFSRHEVKKEYYALVQGAPPEESGTLKDLLFHDRMHNKTYTVNRMRNGVKPAELSYSSLWHGQYNGHDVSLLEVSLSTGRTHQIRVQFASRKLPLVGDRKYGGIPCNDGIALMSCALSFRHPVSGENMSFSLPLPENGPWAAAKHIITSNTET